MISIAGMALVVIILMLLIFIPNSPLQNFMATPTVQTAISQPISYPRWPTSQPLPEKLAGMASVLSDNQIYILGGTSGESVGKNIYSYNSTSNSWGFEGELPIPVMDFQAASISGQIFVPGGQTDSGEVTNRLFSYDLDRKTWDERAPMPEPLSGYALVEYEGNLYIFGGWNGKNIVDSVYIYSPKDDEWKIASHLPQKLAYLSAITYQDRILITGGWDGKSSSAEGYYYYPYRDGGNDDPWVSFVQLPKPRCRHATVAASNFLFIVGGERVVTTRLLKVLMFKGLLPPSISSTTSNGYWPRPRIICLA